jgi:hypothetical protein
MGGPWPQGQGSSRTWDDPVYSLLRGHFFRTREDTTAHGFRLFPARSRHVVESGRRSFEGGTGRPQAVADRTESGPATTSMSYAENLTTLMGSQQTGS